MSDTGGELSALSGDRSLSGHVKLKRTQKAFNFPEAETEGKGRPRLASTAIFFVERPGGTAG